MSLMSHIKTKRKVKDHSSTRLKNTPWRTWNMARWHLNVFMIFQSTSMKADVMGSNISIRFSLAHCSCVEWITLIFHYLIHARLFLLVCLSAGCLLNWWMDFHAYQRAVRLSAKEQLIKCWWGSRCSVSSNKTNDRHEGWKIAFAIS